MNYTRSLKASQSLSGLQVRQFKLYMTEVKKKQVAVSKDMKCKYFSMSVIVSASLHIECEILVYFIHIFHRACPLNTNQLHVLYLMPSKRIKST